MLFDALCGEAEIWDARLRYWDEAFTRFKPDVVLAEYSPGLSMFARGRVPTVVTGTGYSIPPPDLRSFPTYREAEDDALSEADCVETLNRGLRQVGASPLQFLPQMNAGDLVALITLPLFDPYWQVRKEFYLGAEIPSGAPRPGPETSRILAYFSDAVLPESTWAELGEINRQIEVYGSGKRPKNMPANLVMRDRPFDLARDLPGADLAIHCGGLGFSSSAVLAGVRQLVLYEHDEHWGQALGVALARVGIGLPLLSSQPGQVREAAAQLLGDQQYKSFALALAKQYAPFAEARPSERIAKELLLRG
jgi:hypothetical protein